MMTGRWPVGDVDHEDRDRRNNRWANLREATKSQNQANAGNWAHNTSGFRGVSRTESGRWRARIMVGKREISLGRFDTAQEAATAREAKAREIWGAFA